MVQYAIKKPEKVNSLASFLYYNPLFTRFIITLTTDNEIPSKNTINEPKYAIFTVVGLLFFFAIFLETINAGIDNAKEKIIRLSISGIATIVITIATKDQNLTFSLVILNLDAIFINTISAINPKISTTSLVLFNDITK